MKVLGVIPARFGSGRLPGKPIADICGKPMIWWVYQEAIKCKLLSGVVVATDDERIYNVCREYSMNVLMTSKNHDTPTSRLHEVSMKADADLYLMLMGDEPLIDNNSFSLIIPEDMNGLGNCYVSVLTNVIEKPSEVIDFSNQKCVTNAKREVLLISRSPIPYPKGTLEFEYEKVTGIQIFSKAALAFYYSTEKSLLEIAEENDLMRFVENDIKVKAIKSEYKTISVDTKKDLELVRKIIKERSAYEKK